MGCAPEIKSEVRQPYIICEIFHNCNISERLWKDLFVILLLKAMVKSVAKEGEQVWKY